VRGVWGRNKIKNKKMGKHKTGPKRLTIYTNIKLGVGTQLGTRTGIDLFIRLKTQLRQYNTVYVYRSFRNYIPSLRLPLVPLVT